VLQGEFFSFVIPGHREAMNPEPRNTVLSCFYANDTEHLAKSVFMASGFGPAGHLGMTEAIFSQPLRIGVGRRGLPGQLCGGSAGNTGTMIADICRMIASLSEYLNAADCCGILPERCFIVAR
jgi:hypothetical protein